MGAPVGSPRQALTGTPIQADDKSRPPGWGGTDRRQEVCRSARVTTQLMTILAAGIFAAAMVSCTLAVLPPLLPPPTPLTAALWSAVSGIAGFFLPDLWLRDRTTRRQKAIGQVLPDMVDLISVSVEAGMAFDTALIRICQKARNPLTQEFEKYLLEMQLGKPRRRILAPKERRAGRDEPHPFS